jgi:pimeloyl-ACP methyl ester carboxylesterase
MDRTEMPDEINLQRRSFLGVAALGFAAAEFGINGSARAQSGSAAATTIKPGANSSFGSLKQIDAGVLNIGYAEAGPADGPVVILLHGWPYDIHSYVDVAPLLAAKGYRVIVPHLRGYGTTRFLSGETIRNGQQSVIAVDIIALMDALKIEKAILGGCDWGARTVNIVAALWPERCKAMVSVSGYLIGSVENNKMPLPPKAELQWWYQFYFATERGRAGYEKYRRDFAKLIWQLASPKWDFDDATFDRSAMALDNPDHVDIAIHNYRWRLGLAEGEAKYDDLEKRLAVGPVITVPTITLEGDANGAPHPDPSSYAKKILGPICAPDHPRRHRPQPSPGSPAGLRRSRRRGRWVLIKTSLSCRVDASLWRAQPRQESHSPLSSNNHQNAIGPGNPGNAACRMRMSQDASTSSAPARDITQHRKERK